MICRLLTLLTILSFLLPACTYQQRGAAAGGAAGGLTGFLLTKDKEDSTKIAATVAGAVAGGLIGGAIGSYMDKSDRQRVQKALKEVPKDKTRNWTNPKTGHRFTIRPISEIDTDSKGRKYRKATLYARKKGSNKVTASTQKMYL